MKRVACVCAAVVLGLVATPASADDRPSDPTLAKVFSLVNKVRSKPQQCGARLRGPSKRLRYDAALATSAQAHADDMALNNYFSHESLEGRTFIDRINATTYDGQPGGENLASGQQSAKEVVQAWLDSPAHCRNLMTKRFDAVGLGLAFFSDPQYSTPVTFWAQDFGIDN